MIVTCFLEMVGVGYRATSEMDNTLIRFKVGLSHDVVVKVPQSVRVFCFGASQRSTLICCVGTNNAIMTQFAATIRAIKPPEVYKGKGIRYRNEVFLQKQGKKK